MTDTKKCPKCGKQLHSDAQYCMYCMHSLQPKKDVTPVGLNRHGKQLAAIMPVVIAAAVLISIVAVALLKWNSKQAANNHEPNSVQASGQENKPYSSQPDDFPEAPGNSTVKPTQPAVPESTAGQSSKPEPSTKPWMPEPTEPNIPDQTIPEPELPSETTVPEITEPPCSHYYMEANCNTPMTCVYCGNTWGSIDENAHNWLADTVTVHHNEVGHYEEQTDYVKKTKYLCFFCGYSQDGFDFLEEVWDHTPVHSGSSGYDAALPWLDSLIETREVWEEVPVRVWVVDQKAYDETVITGYTCSICGSKKDSEASSIS